MEYCLASHEWRPLRIDADLMAMWPHHPGTDPIESPEPPPLPDTEVEEPVEVEDKP